MPARVPLCAPRVGPTKVCRRARLTASALFFFASIMPPPGARPPAGAGTSRGAARNARGSRAHHGRSLRASVETTQAAWAERRDGAALADANPTMVAVPQDVLDSNEVTLDTLKEYCRLRTIPFGQRPSKQTLRSKLMSFNSDTQTVWSARMASLTARLSGELQVGRGALAPFQAAFYHPEETVEDAPAAPVEPADAGPPSVGVGDMHRLAGRGRPPAPPSRCASPGPTPPSSRRPPSRGHSPLRPPSGGASPLLASSGRPNVLLPALSSGSASLPAALSVPAIDAGRPTGMRESDKKYLEYVAARRREEVEEEEARHQARHEEVRGMMLALGQSMAGVTGALQAHTQSTTVAAARHSEGLVTLTQENIALRAAVATPGVSPEPRRTGKRPRTAGERLQADTGRAPAQALGSGEERTPLRDILFSPTMEPELITAKMKSQPLMEQLLWIVHHAHVSAGCPGLFGCFVVKSIYDQAGRAAAADAAAGRKVGVVNREKKERINNIINNKADLYVRQLFWLRGIVPKVLAIPAGQATKEAVQAITLEPGERAAVTAAIKEAAVKLHYPQSHPILTPSKARMSHLRDMLGALASGHGHTSNVEEMLGTSPFAARLAEASKRISPRFFSPVPPPSCTAVPPPAACAPAFP